MCSSLCLQWVTLSQIYHCINSEQEHSQTGTTVTSEFSLQSLFLSHITKYTLKFLTWTKSIWFYRWKECCWILWSSGDVERWLSRRRWDKVINCFQRPKVHFVMSLHEGSSHNSFAVTHTHKNSETKSCATYFGNQSGKSWQRKFVIAGKIIKERFPNFMKQILSKIKLSETKVQLKSFRDRNIETSVND